MKQIKLEVGKTYRSREGEEVKIVRKGNKGWDYWEGSNGEWYYESGKWSYVTKEHPDDLIEEVPEPCHTFSLVPGAHTIARYIYPIPEGAKKVIVSQEANRIVVEMVPEEGKGPKPGDVMINAFGSVYIFKEVINNNIGRYFDRCYARFGGSLYIGGACIPGRLATPEESKLLFDALKKAGKRWNPKTMQVEDVPKIDHIREWVEKHLNHRYYSHEGLTKVIYDYLKYREDEK